MEQGTPIELAAGQEARNINVALTGAVVDSRGQPATDYTAVIFAEDEARWVFPSRFIRAARPDQRGAFTVRGLPPARYLGVAARSIPEGSWTNPQFLERLVPYAERPRLVPAKICGSHSEFACFAKPPRPVVQH